MFDRKPKAPYNQVPSEAKKPKQYFDEGSKFVRLLPYVGIMVLYAVLIFIIIMAFMYLRV